MNESVSPRPHVPSSDFLTVYRAARFLPLSDPFLNHRQLFPPSIQRVCSVSLTPTTPIFAAYCGIFLFLNRLGATAALGRNDGTDLCRAAENQGTELL